MIIEIVINYKLFIFNINYQIESLFLKYDKNDDKIRYHDYLNSILYYKEKFCQYFNDSNFIFRMQ